MRFVVYFVAFAFMNMPQAWAGLDVYVGPLSKFYKHDYMSTQARMAKELGIEFKTVYPDGEPNWLSQKNAKKKIQSFKRSVAKKASSEWSQWSEEYDDYFIEQLNWDCLESLVFLTMFAIRGDLERPTSFSGDYREHPAYIEAFDMGYYFGPIAVLEAGMFLPTKGTSMILDDNPLGEEIIISTTYNLKMTLKFLEESIWNGNVDPEYWLERGPAPVGAGRTLRANENTGEMEMVDGDYGEIEDPVKYNAEYAYSVLLKALTYAEKHNLPLVMDG